MNQKKKKTTGGKGGKRTHPRQSKRVIFGSGASCRGEETQRSNHKEEKSKKRTGWDENHGGRKRVS